MNELSLMTTMDGAVRRSTSMSKNFQNSFSLSMMKNVFDDENFNAQFVFFVGSSKKKNLAQTNVSHNFN